MQIIHKQKNIMGNMSEQPITQQTETQLHDGQEQEIDLIALVKRLWKKKIFLIYVTGSFMVLGLLVALFSAKEYTSGSTFVPQTRGENVSSSMSSLASLARQKVNAEEEADKMDEEVVA